MRPGALRQTLDECAEHLLNRHLAHAREWFPHELVPWELGRRFKPGERFEAEGAPLPAGVSSALFVNLLTEDNLPHYFHAIARVVGTDSALGEWEPPVGSRGTAARHGVAGLALRHAQTRPGGA